MRRAVNRLRAALHYRRDAFSAGLADAGLRVVDNIADPKPGDVLLIWNRYGGFAEQAGIFERAGATVLVAENCPLGNGWRPGAWYSLARGATAMTGGAFAAGGADRWDGWAVPLAAWHNGGETVILGQRGIGSNDARSPDGWAEKVRAKTGGRIRQHPGTGDGVPLASDLASAGEVITWASAAAVQALVLGVPVWNAHDGFICAGAARPLAEHGRQPVRRDDEARLQALRRMAWAMWELQEIRAGEPIRRLLEM